MGRDLANGKLCISKQFIIVFVGVILCMQIGSCILIQYGLIVGGKILFGNLCCSKY